MENIIIIGIAVLLFVAGLIFLATKANRSSTRTATCLVPDAFLAGITDLVTKSDKDGGRLSSVDILNGPSGNTIHVKMTPNTDLLNAQATMATAAITAGANAQMTATGNVAINTPIIASPIQQGAMIIQQNNAGPNAAQAGNGALPAGNSKPGAVQLRENAAKELVANSPSGNRGLTQDVTVFVSINGGAWADQPSTMSPGERGYIVIDTATWTTMATGDEVEVALSYTASFADIGPVTNYKKP